MDENKTHLRGSAQEFRMRRGIEAVATYRGNQLRRQRTLARRWIRIALLFWTVTCLMLPPTPAIAHLNYPVMPDPFPCPQYIGMGPLSGPGTASATCFSGSCSAGGDCEKCKYGNCGGNQCLPDSTASSTSPSQSDAPVYYAYGAVMEDVTD